MDVHFQQVSTCNVSGIKGTVPAVLNRENRKRVKVKTLCCALCVKTPCLAPQNAYRTARVCSITVFGPDLGLFTYSASQVYTLVHPHTPFCLFLFDGHFAKMLCKQQGRAEPGRRSLGQSAGERLEFHALRKCYNWASEFIDQSQRLTAL